MSVGTFTTATYRLASKKTCAESTLIDTLDNHISALHALSSHFYQVLHNNAKVDIFKNKKYTYLLA